MQYPPYQYPPLYQTPRVRPLGADHEHRILLDLNTWHALQPTHNALGFFFFFFLPRPLKQKMNQKCLIRKLKKDKFPLQGVCGFFNAWIHLEKQEPFDISFNKHKVEKKLDFWGFFALG